MPRDIRYLILLINVDIYKKNYDDPRNAFGDDITRYYRHYCEYGYKEGRNATNLIKKELTENSYPDLTDGVYRVRLAFEDEKSSLGAFVSWKNAYKVWNGYHVYDPSGRDGESVNVKSIDSFVIIL